MAQLFVDPADDIPPRTKQRTCLKCRVAFTVTPSQGNYYTCKVCRKENTRINDRLIPSSRGRHRVNEGLKDS